MLLDLLNAPLVELGGIKQLKRASGERDERDGEEEEEGSSWDMRRDDRKRDWL